MQDVQAAVTNPSQASPEQLLQVQRLYGNRAVQRLLSPAGSMQGGPLDSQTQSQLEGARAGGQPLDARVSRSMGQAMRADFSAVRVHSDEGAHRLNRSLSAQAFTTGSDIFFTKGSYAPGSHQGQKLLAHELTHVVQQNPGLAQRKLDAGAKPNKLAARPGAGPQLSRAKPNKAQTKLVVGAAGDSYEQEADRIASEVMRSIASPAVQPDVQGGIRPEQEGGGHIARQIDVRQSAPAAAVQRAIGFEFEFGTWKTNHENDGSILAKGEKIIGGKGYNIEGEDAGSATASAIEVVTKPFTTKKEAVDSVTQAQDTMQDMSDADPPVKASRYDGAKPNIVITPGDDKGKMQASPAVSLDKMGALYSKGNGAGFANAISGFLQSKAVKKKYLNKQAPSEELMGLVMLVVSYLEQGSRKQALFYPKSAFTIMARTSFDKMMELLPEYDFFSDQKNQQKWVDLIIATAQRVLPSMREEETGKFKTNIFGKTKYKNGKAIPKKRKKSKDEVKHGPALNMPFMDIEKMPGEEDDNPGYKLKTTREEWLLGMTQGEDKLGKGEDKRFEGMGAYGGAMDVEALETEAETGIEKALEESGLVEKVKLEKEEDNTNTDTPAPQKAPLFELRGLRDMFAIDQDVSLTNWTDKVKEVFDIIDDVNGKAFKPGGKPTVAPDVDKPAVWEKV